MTVARTARPTVSFIDEYCQLFSGLFPEVRSFEAFKLLHLGIISGIGRKSLPAIAKTVGLGNQQNLHHFLSASPWSVYQFRQHRLQVILEVLKGQSILLLIEDSGDCKKGCSIDYVQRQYFSNLHRRENGITAITVYGLVDGMVLPLAFEVYKPKERLKPEDEYRSKSQIVAKLIQHLRSMGFVIELILSDSLCGESRISVVEMFDAIQIPYILVVRSDRASWLPQDQNAYQEPWQELKRTLNDGMTEVRYITEVLYGDRKRTQYCILSNHPQTLPANFTCFIVVDASLTKLEEIMHSYGFRLWIDYGLKQVKDALGWPDFRMTRYEQIERWWEMIMSAFQMVRLFESQFESAFPLAHQSFLLPGLAKN